MQQMKTNILLVTACALLTSIPALANPAPKVDAARVDAVLKDAFKQAPADWAPRLEQDATMKTCSDSRNNPSKADFEAIQAREKATIQYPADGKLIGDWQKGEKIAQSGYGMRFTDYPPANPNGGNCYACHQLTKAEVSYGTIGPSLLGYGANRKFAEADVKAAYEKIYNAHAAQPCSLMPRFGANKILNIEQIKDLTALLMSPDSPVNK
jgi:sulfur-oxidizing protein SoxX